MSAMPRTVTVPGMAASVKLHPMVVADMKAPPNYWDGNASFAGLLKGVVTPRSKYVWLPIPAFLVEHPEEGPILIDTAFEESVGTDPSRSLGRIGSKIFSPIRMSPDGVVPEQLRARGIAPTDIRMVVMTHLHFDHTSGIGQFPSAEFVVEQRELAAVKGGLAKGYMPAHLEPVRQWRKLDLRDAPAAEGFDHVHDLLGDGTIRLAFTPGHTDGHCSILVQTETGPVLLTGDAAYARRSIDERWVPLTVAGKVSEYKDSLERIAAWAAAHPGAPVICGHDPWSRADLERSY
ncbi:MAG: beta-lactamase domain protein [Solirubrobacterales bacterium]|nr:beta-lactamase domain protein [Solirubrobacterales bacterium]